MHDVDDTVLPRLVARTLAERLRIMPALVVTGARQTGKSTLVQQLTPGTRRYRSLDDLDVLDAAADFSADFWTPMIQTRITGRFVNGGNRGQTPLSAAHVYTWF